MQLKEWPPEMTRADLMTVSEAAAELGYRDGRQIRAAIRDGRLTATGRYWGAPRSWLAPTSTDSRPRSQREAHRARYGDKASRG